MYLFILASLLALASVCQAQLNPAFYEPVQPPRSQQVVQAGGLQQLDCGSWFSERTRGLRLASLTDLLDQSRHRVNLQLECQDVPPKQLVKEILSTKINCICQGLSPLFARDCPLFNGPRGTVPFAS